MNDNFRGCCPGLWGQLESHLRLQESWSQKLRSKPRMTLQFLQFLRFLRTLLGLRVNLLELRVIATQCIPFREGGVGEEVEGHWVGCLCLDLCWWILLGILGLEHLNQC